MKLFEYPNYLNQKMKYFSSNAKFLREKFKFTQSEIKDRLDIEPTTWSNYERGKSFPNLKKFFEVCKLFGVSETDFLNSDLANTDITLNIKEITNFVNEPASKYDTTQKNDDYKQKYYDLLEKYNACLEDKDKMRTGITHTPAVYKVPNNPKLKS